MVATSGCAKPHLARGRSGAGRRVRLDARWRRIATPSCLRTPCSCPGSWRVSCGCRRRVAAHRQVTASACATARLRAGEARRACRASGSRCGDGVAGVHALLLSKAGDGQAKKIAPPMSFERTTRSQPGPAASAARAPVDIGTRLPIPMYTPRGGMIHRRFVRVAARCEPCASRVARRCWSDVARLTGTGCVATLRTGSRVPTLVVSCGSWRTGEPIARRNVGARFCTCAISAPVPRVASRRLSPQSPAHDQLRTHDRAARAPGVRQGVAEPRALVDRAGRGVAGDGHHRAAVAFREHGSHARVGNTTCRPGHPPSQCDDADDAGDHVPSAGGSRSSARHRGEPPGPVIRSRVSLTRADRPTRAHAQVGRFRFPSAWCGRRGCR